MITEAEATNVKIRCPKCGRDVESLVCGHCGSTLESWQSDLYGAAVRQLARLGGNRADAGHQGAAVLRTQSSKPVCKSMTTSQETTAVPR